VAIDEGARTSGCNPNSTVNWEILKLTPAASGSWISSVITAVDHAGEDPEPAGDLAIDSTGALYLTTGVGVTVDYCAGTGGCGVVWKIAPPTKATSRWSRTSLYTFNFSDGEPADAVVMGEGGILYGRSVPATDCADPDCSGAVIPGWHHKNSDGASECAQNAASCTAVYELTPPSSAVGTWKKTIVSYGINDYTTPVRYRSGALYIGQLSDNNYGGPSSLLKLAPTSGGNLWNATALYNFTSHDANYIFGVLIGQNGVIYATGTSTAKTSQGTIVEVTP